MSQPVCEKGLYHNDSYSDPTFHFFCSQVVLCLDYNVFQNVSQIPIMVVMKAMGMESDQEVVQMVGRDPRYSALLLPSIEVIYIMKFLVENVN